jgi:hypothetical protein
MRELGAMNPVLLQTRVLLLLLLLLLYKRAFIARRQHVSAEQFTRLLYIQKAASSKLGTDP